MENIQVPIDQEELVRIRRRLHMYPELKWDLPMTPALVKEELERAGLSSFFKGLLSARDYGEGEAGPALCLRALRRMGTAPRATAVFTTQPDQREPLEQLALFPVLVGPAARETGQGDGFIPDYREMIKAL